MAVPAPPAQAGKLIGGAYAVDLARPLPGAGGGLAAFAATDQRSPGRHLMAVQSAPGAPPRAMALNALVGWDRDGLLVPVAHGPAPGAQGGAAWFVVSAAPPGPSLAATLRPWSEPDLLEQVLRPAALALEGLETRRVTHRAIRTDNIFHGGPGTPVLLGNAWSAPPAQHQPSLFEPPYSAMCLPCARGDGAIADDVYALGVVLVVLALGRMPMEGLDGVAILRRKLALGSYAALVGEERLPPVIGDLVRGMLAEDPDHRPPPALLADPGTARARRVAARPPRRGQRALDLAGAQVWDARSLAHAVATDAEAGAQLLRSGAVDRWLRRSLGDPVLAVRLDEVVRLRGLDSGADEAHADALMSMRAVAALDPLAPLCWRNTALWPDGVGPALAAADVTSGPAGSLLTERLADLVNNEIVGHWAAMRPERCDANLLRNENRQRRTMLRLRGWAGGLPRLRYATNPLLACKSPILAGRTVARLADLLPALEDTAARRPPGRERPVDREIAAFIAARHDQRAEGEVVDLTDAASPEEAVLSQLRLLAGLQQRSAGGPLPALAGWLAEQAAPALAAWHNKVRREALQRSLGEMAQAGQLAPMVGLLENAAARTADQRGFQAASEAVQRLDLELTALTGGGEVRAGTARRIGHEAALGIGMMAMTVALVALVLS